MIAFICIGIPIIICVVGWTWIYFDQKRVIRKHKAFMANIKTRTEPDEAELRWLGQPWRTEAEKAASAAYYTKLTSPNP